MWRTKSGSNHLFLFPGILHWMMFWYTLYTPIINTLYHFSRILLSLTHCPIFFAYSYHYHILVSQEGGPAERFLLTTTLRCGWRRVGGVALAGHIPNWRATSRTLNKRKSLKLLTVREYTKKLATMLTFSRKEHARRMELPALTEVKWSIRGTIMSGR